MLGGDMNTTVNLGGTSMGLQAAVDQAVASLRALSLNLDELDAQSSSTGASMSVLGRVFTNSGFSLEGLLSTFGLSSGPIGAFTGLIGQVTGGIGQMVEQATAFVGAMAGWAIIQQVISWVQQLSDELFNLQVQTQRLDVGWSYIFGSQGHAQGQAISRELMAWSSQFSMHIPFTRQDLMSGITTLATAGLNPQQIMQFMPYLSDIAATYGSASYGGRGVNLQQAANAIRMASMGLSRMLKYDLNITPEELVPYGLVGKASSTGFRITDPNSLFRALENFAQAKGVAGASQGIVGSTWWGGWSSLVDNMQNFLLQVGGTNLNGTIQPGSFFGTLQTKLDQLLGWFTEHQSQIKSFADLLSHLLGDVVTGGGGLLGAFINELDKLHVVQDIEGGVKQLDGILRSWFGLDEASQKPTGGHSRRALPFANGAGAQSAQPSGPLAWLAEQAPYLSQIGQAFAQLAQAGGSFDWSLVQSFFASLGQYIPQVLPALAQLVRDMVKFFTTMTPQERAQLQQFFAQLGNLIGMNTLTALQLLDASLQTMQTLLPVVLPLLNSMLDIVQAMSMAYQAWAGNIQQAADAFAHLTHNAPPWLIDALKLTPGGVLFSGQPWQNPFGGSSSSGSSGNGLSGYGAAGAAAATNATRTPGGYRTFGATGRSMGK